MFEPVIGPFKKRFNDLFGILQNIERGVMSITLFMLVVPNVSSFTLVLATSVVISNAVSN